MTLILFLSIGLALAFVSVKANVPYKGLLRFDDDVFEERSSRSSLSRADLVGNTWTNKTIPYEINPNFPNPSRQLFFKAIHHVMTRTCVRFKPRSNEGNYIHIMEDTANGNCESDVGMKGGRLLVYLSAKCALVRGFLHELVHVIGFEHEHSRPDRDQFVTINLENVEQGKKHNLDKLEGDCTKLMGVPYDYKSIMHYSKIAFSKNDYETITPMDPDVTTGIAPGLSDFDIRRINRLYCWATKALRFQNVADGNYLTVRNDNDRPIITSIWTGAENQKWTVEDWHSMKNISKGTRLVTWSYSRNVECLISRPHSRLIQLRECDDNTAGDFNKWIIKMKQPAPKDSSWIIVNKGHDQCLFSDGTHLPWVDSCNASNPMHLWRIFNA